MLWGCLCTYIYYKRRSSTKRTKQRTRTYHKDMTKRKWWGRYVKWVLNGRFVVEGTEVRFMKECMGGECDDLTITVIVELFHGQSPQVIFMNTTPAHGGRLFPGSHLHPANARRMDARTQDLQAGLRMHHHYMLAKVFNLSYITVSIPTFPRGYDAKTRSSNLRRRQGNLSPLSFSFNAITSHHITSHHITSHLKHFTLLMSLAFSLHLMGLPKY